MHHVTTLLAAFCAVRASALAVPRRAFVGGFGVAVVAPVVVGAPVAAVAAGPPEVVRLKAGYDGIQSLLTNWDRDTFKSCGVAGQIALASECERDPTKVPLSLGLKTTDHPLFKVEKLFKTALNSDAGDNLDIDTWNAATEGFIQHSTSAQEYAYTASFAEYNPSGGKDQLAKYMDLSKDELALARDALKDILTQLSVKL